MSLDVEGFGDIYKYLKRIGAREDVKSACRIRMAEAKKKDYKKFIDMLEVWLPGLETSNTKKDSEAFQKKVRKGF